MKIGGRYNWTGQRERLIYLGRNWSGNGFWHQFALVDKPDDVWCEVRDEQLSSFEETKVPGPLSELMAGVDRLAARAGRVSNRAMHRCHCGGRIKLGAADRWSCGTGCAPAPDYP